MMIVGILYVSFLLCLICLDIGGCHLGGRGDGVGCGYPLGGGWEVRCGAEWFEEGAGGGVGGMGQMARE